MANKIIIGPLDAPILQFEDDAIISIVDESAVSLIGAELAVDLLEPELEYTVYVDYDLVSSDDYTLISSDGYELRPFSNYDLRALPYATKITYIENNRINGEFFSRNVERVGRTRYKVNAISAVGLMEKQTSKGGLYIGQRFDSVLAEILGDDYEYSIADDVAQLQVYGWLPYSTRRFNLHKIITAYGVNIVRSDTGGMLFTILADTPPDAIPEHRIYVDGSVDYGEPASRVEVTEHSFFYLDSAAEETVFDNTGSDLVDHALVTFNQPFYPDSIRCSEGNLEIIERHVNYAIVSGVGILVGKPYTHTTKVVSADNENAVIERVVRLTDDTLVTVANADNVLLRLSAYYFNAVVVHNAVQLEGEKCGRRYEMLNAFYERTSGFLAKISASASSITKAECEFIENYIPTGQGNTYMFLDRLTEASGVWKIPDSVFEKPVPYIRVVLIGPGEKGGDGKNGSKGGDSDYQTPGPAGIGGAGGAAGNGGKILSITIDCTGLEAFDFAVNSSAVTMRNSSYQLSSANGVSSPTGFLEVFSGAVYALPGVAGANGADGGTGGFYPPPSLTGGAVAKPGKDVTYNGRTYYGGAAASRIKYPSRPESNDVYISGGGGGGAAVGANGSPGQANTSTWLSPGGKGANAISPAATATQYGSGGNGGHGGGGGGGGGHAISYNWLYGVEVGWLFGVGGAGGAGSKGTAGAPGCILIYY